MKAPGITVCGVAEIRQFSLSVAKDARAKEGAPIGQTILNPNSLSTSPLEQDVKDTRPHKTRVNNKFFFILRFLLQ